MNINHVNTPYSRILRNPYVTPLYGVLSLAIMWHLSWGSMCANLKLVLVYFINTPPRNSKYRDYHGHRHGAQGHDIATPVRRTPLRFCYCTNLGSSTADQCFLERSPNALLLMSISQQSAMSFIPLPLTPKVQRNAGV